MKPDVLIIGGGLAGLTCANILTQQGISNLIVEADDDVGGRARTDRLDGFLLDRGFQVFSTAYPEAKRLLNYDALRLRTFYPGALVRFDGQFHHIADPYRHPIHAVGSLLNPIGTMKDKMRVGLWRHRVCTGSVQDLLQKSETTTMDHLNALGFSQSIINRFFRPFFGGVFMDQELTTSSRLADFAFRMFAMGDIALPKEGIGALATQLAHNLPDGHIRTCCKVVKIQGTTTTLESGETISAQRVIIATEGSSATQLAPEYSSRSSRQTTCVYFHAPEPPTLGPYLILNGETHGVINSMCLLTEVTRSYAPPNQHLVAVTTYENSNANKSTMEDAVRRQLAEWFGKQVSDWRYIRTYHIQHAQPSQYPPFNPANLSDSKLRDGLFICGDHRSTATFDGAIGSGRRTAEAVINDLTVSPIAPFENIKT